MGLGFVCADLLSNGIQVALPLSEHLPFDCIAISDSGELKRVSVKYRAAVNGALEISRRSVWSDRHGSHVKTHPRGAYDAFAVYCPDTAKCYYILENEIIGTYLKLRLCSPKNSQKKGVHSVTLFTNPKRLFDPVA